VRSRFTYVGSTVIEVVVDGDSLTWNVLETAAAAPVVPPQEAPPPEPPPVPAAAPEEPLLAPVPDEVEDEMTPAAAPLEVAAPPQRRGLKAFIRGAWTFAIAMFVEGGSYLVSNLTALDIPPGVGLAGGALLQGAIYGAKKYVAPDTIL